MKTLENNRYSVNINGVLIRELLPEDARQVAELHIKGIKTGFISSLGISFVSAVYESIAKSKNAFGLVVLKDSKIIGFAAFAVDTAAFYRAILFKKGLRFAFLLAGTLFSPRRIRNVVQTLFYPARTKKMAQLPKAELLSIVITAEERGRGFSQILIREGFSLCRQKKIDNIKVLVGADNEPANRLYQKCGFTLLYQVYNHGILSNIYASTTNYFQNR
jgi:ribosomal protein S18 acetylase RimI-like enzyme